MATSSLLSGMANRLQGKVAIVTGGASGIGKCTAKLLQRYGAKVIIADIQDELGHSACNEMGSKGVSFVHCNVTKEADVRSLVDTATAQYGRLDIMFNNAGAIDSAKQNITDVEQTDFERILAVNVTGVFLGMKHAARVMAPARQGSIVNTASVCSVVGGIGTYAYTASKHAVVGLTKHAAVELGQYGVRVNSVSPFVVHTPLLEAFLGEALNSKATAEGIYSNLKGVELKGEDIADAVVYLGSDESKYVSGHNLVVDGGFVIHNTAFTSYNHVRP